ncbi:MAG: Eco57I restriction-modification methylase domain-containing protein [bacterium]
MPQPNIKILGQVFTPPRIVAQMLALRQNRGAVLEPSCGDGAFMRALGEDATGIEIDARIAPTDKRVITTDFFAYPVHHKFDTVIGNPPYVRFRDIREQTKPLLPMQWFDRRTNLYLFFIAKSMQHLPAGGELIFVTPRDFIKSTNARQLNAALYAEGAITDFYELGDARVFAGVTPNCAIWRWQKGRRNKSTKMRNRFCCRNGQIWFGDDRPENALGNYFEVKVGAVSGADPIFSHRKYANAEMVCSRTASTGEIRKMIYNRKCKYLEQYKQVLMNRRIRKFDETNWWEWGRKYHQQEGPRIYVNCKTRNPKPFFISEMQAYDGSVMALFPRNGVDIAKAVAKLNQINWHALGFVCDGRLQFTQRSLQNAPVGEILA